MRILLVCEQIAPLQTIAAVRWTKIAKYLKRQHGDEVQIDVLTRKKNYDDPNSKMRLFRKDPLLESDMVNFKNYFAVPVGMGLSLGDWYKKKVVGYNRRFFTAEEFVSSSWKKTVKYRLLKMYTTYVDIVTCGTLWRSIRGKIGDYDVIISSYEPIWPFMVCRKIKSRNKKVRWIADFRNPCGREGENLWGHARWHKGYVRKHSAIADAVIRVDDYMDTCTNERAKIYMVPNGYDPNETVKPQKSDTFDFVLTGTLYGEKTDFTALYTIINQLIEEKHVDKKKIRVVYAGRTGDQAQLMAEENHADAYFVNLHELTRDGAHEVLSKASILVQLAFNEENDRCVWSGKMYDYMMSGKPIAIFVSGSVPNSYPSKYAGKLGAACYEKCRHDETYGPMVDYIKNKYDEWVRTGDVTITRDEDYVNIYSYKHIAERVWEIIESIDGKRS